MSSSRRSSSTSAATTHREGAGPRRHGVSCTRAVERALERVVAIKVVPPESANAGQAAERFRREARLAASLDHPNIIPVYRVGPPARCTTWR